MSLDISLAYKLCHDEDIYIYMEDIPQLRKYDLDYNLNITHNLTEMASKCGLYDPIWRPYRIYGVADEDEDTIKPKAEDLISPIETGLRILKADPERFKDYNPENSWGSYESLVWFVEKYLNILKAHPDAYVEVCR